MNTMLSKNTKIAYILKRYPRFSETFVVNEILAHEAAGQPIEIFALRPVEDKYFQNIISLVKAPVTRIPDHCAKVNSFWSLLCKVQKIIPNAWEILSQMDGVDDGQDLAQALHLTLACHQRGITHLHAHFGTLATTVARIAAALLDIPYTFTSHAKDIYFQYEEPTYLDLKLRDAACAVTVSDYNVAYLKENFGEDANQVVRLYNGLNLDLFQWQEPLADSTEILAVGRLVKKKGFHILIEAILILKEQGYDVSCRIVGSGEEEETLSAQILYSGLQNVVFLEGPKPQKDVITSMRNAALLACPCVVSEDGNRDGLPTVLLEAMALGLPVISTDVTGIPELVHHEETGLCLPEGDPEVLADGIKRVLQDQELRKKISYQGRKFIEQEFDVAKNAASLRDIFQQASLQKISKK